jgi:hypothetical protein
MTTPRAASHTPANRSRSGSFRRDDLPDRRGENLAIFTTIFIRPALELKSPVRRLAGALAATGGRIVSGRAH